VDDSGEFAQLEVLDLSDDPELAELEAEFTRKVSAVLARREREAGPLVKAAEELDELEAELKDALTKHLAKEGRRVAAALIKAIGRAR
jgi:hypothetical protein